MMTNFIITLSFYKAPSSGGAFPFQPLADSPIVDERRTPRNAFPEAVLLGDRLIVAVNSDASTKRLKGDSRPVNPLEQRMIVLGALEAVDWVVSFEEDTPQRLIAGILPDLLVKGGDYKPEEIAGSKEVWANGGEVLVLNFEDGCSTTNIIKKIQLDKKG